MRSDQAVADDDRTTKVIPVASVVVPVKETEDLLTWEEVVQGYFTRNRRFDDKYRRPTGPTYGIAVDCSRNQRLGAIIEFVTGKRNVNEVLPLRFTWSHTDADETGSRTKYRNPWPMPRLKGVLIYSDYLSLSDKRRRNGSWVLKVYHLGEQVYQEEFDLKFCEREYAPVWHDD